ncbi:MAG: permease, partial [Pseudomonadota bacterium]|nr:permease [Pseudomonadota bacterium]
FDWLPDRSHWTSPAEQDHFQLNYQFWLNVIFGLASLWMVVSWRRQQSGHNNHGHYHHHHGGGQPIMNTLCILAGLWLSAGLILTLF